MTRLKCVNTVAGQEEAAEVGAAGKFLKTQMSNTRGETLAMSAATGVAIGTTNNQINKHYIQKGKARYHARRLNGLHGTALKGGGN